MEILAFGHNPVDVDRFPNHVKDCVCFYFIVNISHFLCTYLDLQGEFEHTALKLERDYSPNIKDCELEHTLIYVNWY